MSPLGRHSIRHLELIEAVDTELVTESGEEESVYPVCVTGGGCQNLPSPPVPHADCVFRVQTHGHQALRREQRQKYIRIEPTLLQQSVKPTELGPL